MYDNNNLRTLGGRFAILLPFKFIEIGVSHSKGPFLDSNLFKHLIRTGVDFSLNFNKLHFKSKFLEGRDEKPNIEDYKKRGSYFSIFYPVTNEFYVSYRHSRYKLEDNYKISEDMFCLGIYWLENLLLKLETRILTERDISDVFFNMHIILSY